MKRQPAFETVVHSMNDGGDDLLRQRCRTQRANQPGTEVPLPDCELQLGCETTGTHRAAFDDEDYPNRRRNAIRRPSPDGHFSTGEQVKTEITTGVGQRQAGDRAIATLTVLWVPMIAGHDPGRDRVYFQYRACSPVLGHAGRRVDTHDASIYSRCSKPLKPRVKVRPALRLPARRITVDRARADYVDQRAVNRLPSSISDPGSWRDHRFALTMFGLRAR